MIFKHTNFHLWSLEFKPQFQQQKNFTITWLLQRRWFVKFPHTTFLKFQQSCVFRNVDIICFTVIILKLIFFVLCKVEIGFISIWISIWNIHIIYWKEFIWKNFLLFCSAAYFVNEVFVSPLFLCSIQVSVFVPVL